MLRVQRQPLLHALQQIDGKQARHIEDEHQGGIAAPAHVVAGIDAAEAIKQPLYRSADALHAIRRIGEHGRHVRAERLDREQRENEVEPNLQQIVGSHSNHSGFSSATAR